MCLKGGSARRLGVHLRGMVDTCLTAYQAGQLPADQLPAGIESAEAACLHRVAHTATTTAAQCMAACLLEDLHHFVGVGRDARKVVVHPATGRAVRPRLGEDAW